MAGTVQGSAGAGIILCQGFDLSPYLQSIEVDQQQDMKDRTNFASGSAKEYAVGLADRSMKAEGFYGDNPANDTLSADYLFNSLFGAGQAFLLTAMPEGATVGNRAIMMNNVLAKYEPNIKVGELLMALFEAKATGKTGTQGSYARGIALMSQTVTGAVNGAAFDNVTTSVGWMCQVHNTNADGTLSGKVQHSTNGTVWVDLITVTALAANTAVQFLDTSTTVNEFRRFITTAIGGTTNKASVGFASPYSG